MLVFFADGAFENDLEAGMQRIRSLGPNVHRTVSGARRAFAVLGDTVRVDLAAIWQMRGVAEVVRAQRPWKLASREASRDGTVILVGGARISQQSVTIIAGPCSVESRERILEAARGVREAGATLLRGGAFKPRTGPYEFQGLGERGLELLAEARDATGLGVVTEVLDAESVPLVAAYTDVLQIGARNMQNFTLLRRVAQIDRPVLLKRGPSATQKEFLMAAEYLLAGGNHRVILCERGIRMFETMSRYTLDLNAVPILKQLTHLPVFVDPSDGIGIRNLVPAMARAALVAGADGLIVEVHPCPEQARSDGAQSLDPAEFDAMMAGLGPLAECLRRTERRASAAAYPS